MNPSQAVCSNCRETTSCTRPPVSRIIPRAAPAPPQAPPRAGPKPPAESSPLVSSSPSVTCLQHPSAAARRRQRTPPSARALAAVRTLACQNGRAVARITAPAKRLLPRAPCPMSCTQHELQRKCVFWHSRCIRRSTEVARSGRAAANASKAVVVSCRKEVVEMFCYFSFIVKTT